MTLLVRDEEDIIRQNIEFHLAQGIDFIIATDNLSVDSTTAILRSYEAQGVLHYILEEDDNYNQHAWVTRMARMACTQFGADWVINNDADEFWWPLSGTLNSSLSDLPGHVNVLRAQRSNFVITGVGKGPFFEEMIYREARSLNPLGRPLPPKVAHRGSPSVQVAQGNHTVTGMGETHTSEGVVEILHFPVRTLLQLENKIIKGGAAYARNTELPESAGNTWRSLYRDLIANESLAGFFSQHFYEADRLNRALAKGSLIEDTRLRDFLRGLKNLNQNQTIARS